jgi:hypothetical protein
MDNYKDDVENMYKRQVGYCMERFTGFYFYLLEKQKPDIINYSFNVEWDG